ncbi:MAG: Alpha/beta hydrolase [Candidatus Poribacteria bacterium]|nr:Alpha/beta hydrolase [Candidatus Poribacteria bacterium]
MYKPELSLQNEVVSACRESLTKGTQKRRSIVTKEDYQSWCNGVKNLIRSAFPEKVFDPPKALNSRVVSSYEFDEYRIENVLFESLPGWEVNGSVYLPKQPGIYPGVVCPTGHSTKTGKDYQKSAQVFARNGYIAISFDPPGCAGENRHLNDHFTNGLIGYLTGFWSQTHFVIDAIRCIDYLLTRSDVDKTAGISVTGVSGGGVTSFFTALLDDRVAFAAPVCCLAEHESLHLTGLYTSCPEQFGYGYIASGIDYVDYISAIAPRPCLVMGGKYDEVFDYRSTIRIFEDIKSIYATTGFPDNCGLFIDENSGHAYTVDMANETVKWMNRFIKKSDLSDIILRDDQVTIVESEKLLCHPDSKANMFTINQDTATQLESERANQSYDLRSVAENLLGIKNVRPLSVKTDDPHTSWHTLVEKIDIQSAVDVHLPGIMLTHVEDKSPRPGLLWIDENGKWSGLLHGGFLCGSLRMFEPEPLPDQPCILSIDVSGFGLLSPEPTAYDLAGWNDIERILTYLSIANSKPIMGLRVRDALCGLNYLISRSEVDISRIMVGGRGIGAIVALHIALLNPIVHRVICVDMLSHYGALTEKFPFSWRQSIIIPDILKYYDLPEIIAKLKGVKTFVINPMDAQKMILSQDEVDKLYINAVIQCKINVDKAVNEAIYTQWIRD